jgi:transcriptional regulator with XRE-family HTH domain
MPYTRPPHSNLTGGLFRKRRNELGLSQEQLVAKLQVLGLSLDRTALSRIESFQRSISDVELGYLMEALKVDPQAWTQSLCEEYQDQKTNQQQRYENRELIAQFQEEIPRKVAETDANKT